MPDNNDEHPAAYVVQQDQGRFHVRNASDRTVMVCADRASAEHYVSLLNEAFSAGYKSGYREGRGAR